MAKVKIADLSTISGAVASGDLLPFVDVSDTTDSAEGTTKKVTSANLLGAGINATVGTLVVNSTLGVTGAATFVNLTTTGTTTLGDSGDATTVNGTLNIKTANAARFYRSDDADYYDIGAYTGGVQLNSIVKIQSAGGVNAIFPTTNNATDLGTSALAFKDGYLSGTLGVTGVTTLTGNVGIGAAPSNKLSINGTGNITPDITSTNGGTAAIIYTSTGGTFDNWQVGTGAYGVAGFNFADTTVGLSRFTILNGGNVGIGTVAPLSKLSINGGLHVGGDSDAGDNNALIDGTLEVTGVTTLASYLAINGSRNTAFSYYTNVFQIKSSEATTDNFIVAQVNEGSDVVGLIFNVGTVSGRSILEFQNLNGPVGSITLTGSTTTYATSSDYRLKANINPIVDGLNKVNKLNPISFNFKKDTTLLIEGFLAHEVQLIVPMAVSGVKDEMFELEDKTLKEKYQQMDSSKLIPIMVSAIKELSAKVTALENK